jgi:uncharacterized protein (DUF1501 family)
MADALSSDGMRVYSYSLNGGATWSQGFTTNNEVVHRTHGAVRLEQFSALKHVIGNITQQKYKQIFAEEYCKGFDEAVQSSESLGTYLDTVTLNTEQTFVSDNSFGQQLRQVARLIKTRDNRSAERDFFFVQLGGFDAHSNAAEVLSENFKIINDALELFVTEIEAQGMFENIVMYSSSDFGRSLTSNGAGTDHGWAGNHFVIGGGINGGKVYNDFPTSLVDGNSQDAGRGRLIPKYPWESMLVPIAEWLGVGSQHYPTVFPNLGNFDQSSEIISRSALFSS